MIRMTVMSMLSVVTTMGTTGVTVLMDMRALATQETAMVSLIIVMIKLSDVYKL